MKVVPPLDRRRFLAATGAGIASLSAAGPLGAIAGPFVPKDVVDHFVPADKKLQPEWIKALSERGERTWYSGGDLKMIAMPIGGITTGQLYMAGDGRLVHWDIFNQHNFVGLRRQELLRRGTHRRRFNRALPSACKAAARPSSGRSTRQGFPGVRFCGEYPIAFVEYKDKGLPGGGHAGGLLAVRAAERRGLGPAGHGDAVHGQEHLATPRPR